MHHEHTPAAIRERLAKGPRNSYLRDFIYGGIDGAVTTFAIVSGVVGADLSSGIVLILGFANLLADGFSMAAANYSGTRAERHELELLRETEKTHIREHPEGEREEIRQIYEQKGFRGAELETIVARISEDEDLWIRTMLQEEYGVAPDVRSAGLAAASTFAAFVICGAVPLAPFALHLDNAATLSLAATLAVFFAIGSAKSRWSLVAWWKSGLETLVIGSAAAAIAYGVGVLLGGMG